MGKSCLRDWRDQEEVPEKILISHYLIRWSRDEEKIRIWRAAVRHFKKYRRQHGLFCAIARVLKCSPATARRKWDTEITAWLSSLMVR